MTPLSKKKKSGTSPALVFSGKNVGLCWTVKTGYFQKKIITKASDIYYCMFLMNRELTDNQ